MNINANEVYRDVINQENIFLKRFYRSIKEILLKMIDCVKESLNSDICYLRKIMTIITKTFYLNDASIQ